MNFPIAILISLILIIFELLGEFLNSSLPAIFKWLPFIVMVASIIIACYGYSKDVKNEIKFRKVFIYGMKITAAIMIIIVVYRLLYLCILFPETKTNVIEQARNEMISKYNSSENEIDAATNLIRRIFIPFAIIGSILSTLFSGAIGSIIGASIVKKNSR